jgi:hypothetical protein
MLREYRSIAEVAGPLMLVQDVEGVTYNELGEIELSNGEIRRCKVLEIDGDCLRTWRRQESLKEGNKILIVSEDKYYAFFEISELLDILGVRQKFKVRMNC